MPVLIERLSEVKPLAIVNAGQTHEIRSGSFKDLILPGRTSLFQVEVDESGAMLSTLSEHKGGFWEAISCYRTPRFDVEKTERLEPGVSVLLPRKTLSGAIEFIQITNKP